MIIPVFAKLPRRPGANPSRMTRLWGALAVLNLPLVLAFPLVISGHVGLGIGVAVVFEFALFVALAYWGWDSELELASGLMALHLVFGLVYFGKWVALASREFVSDVSVSQAARHPDAGGYYLTDGRMLTDRMFTHLSVHGDEGSRSDAGTHNWWCAVPLVGDDWREGDPIRIWVGEHVQRYASSGSSAAKLKPEDTTFEFQGDRRAVVRVDPGAEKRYREAIIFERDPIIVRVVADPKAELSRKKWTALAVTGGFNALLLLVLGIACLVKDARKQRRAASEGESENPYQPMT